MSYLSSKKSYILQEEVIESFTITKDNIDETLNDKITIVPSSFIDELFK